jgi:hypothetical protein
VTEEIDVKAARDRVLTRRIWWAFVLFLALMPPVNKYLTGPLAGRVLEALGSIWADILGGVIAGAVFGGLIWLIATRWRAR